MNILELDNDLFLEYLDYMIKMQDMYTFPEIKTEEIMF